MMTNKEIARQISELASFMELYDENAFRIKSYQNAYLQLRRLQEPLEQLSDAQIAAIKGVGKSVATKIREIIQHGELAELRAYKAKTPDGVQEMLQLKGFGAKKIRVIWQELGAETLGELLYACNENRLIQLKGFGEKTQASLVQQIEYFQQSKGKYRYATLEAEALLCLQILNRLLPDVAMDWTGAMRRRMSVVERIEMLVATEPTNPVFTDEKLGLQGIEINENILKASTSNGFPIWIRTCQPAEFGSKLFKWTGNSAFVRAFAERAEGVDFRNLPTESVVFEKAGLPFIEPELRENPSVLEEVLNKKKLQLIDNQDIRGVVHAHSTYSDGYHTLRQMAEHCRNRGFDYLAISDHSKSAFYANGLKPDRVLEQMAEIDQLNAELAPFKIFKGIESDILGDGSLDYETEILEKFDFIIASVHAHLKMDETKATERLIRAIENPHTTILGHPTGRLLLAREGYPIDYQAVINACAEQEVAIEINANPHRLDLDWQWVRYATERGVLIAVNPDAHSTEGVSDIRFGIFAARKGGLTPEHCLNALSLVDFEAFLKNRKIKKGIFKQAF